MLFLACLAVNARYPLSFSDPCSFVGGVKSVCPTNGACYVIRFSYTNELAQVDCAGEVRLALWCLGPPLYKD
jgi:hypothetical protein